MKTKIALILIVSVFAGVNGMKSFGQQKITDMVTRLEEAAKSPPKPNSIEVMVSMEKNEDGSLKITRKDFRINDWPNMVKELTKAFDQEKENAWALSETLRSGNVYKTYVFLKDGQQTTCTMMGQENRMMFHYRFEPKSTTVEVHFGGSIGEDPRRPGRPSR